MSFLNQILGIAIAQAQTATEKAGDVANSTGNELTKLIGNFIASIPLWIAAIVVAFLSYVVAIGVKKALEAKLAEQGIEEEHKEVKIVAGRSAFFGVLIIGITVSLSIVGIDLKPIVAAGAFGMGFALQDIIMNLISGMFILASHHYTIGDVISMGGVVGRIEEIQTRATIIKAFDGTKVIVPNRELFSNVVISKTSNPYRKLSFIMGVDYSSDLKQTMDLTLAVVKSIPWVLKKPKPRVIFYEWGDYSINFRINVWIDSKGGKLLKVKNAVIMELSKAYNESGINIPYPIQTIFTDKAEEESLSQEELTSRVKALKAKYKAKSLDASPATPNLQALMPATAVASVASETVQPGIVASSPVIPVDNVLPSLPVAIQTTPNSPGQGWLQQALQTQVSATSAAPAVSTENPAPIATSAPAPIENVQAAPVMPQSAPVVPPSDTTSTLPGPTITV